MLGKNCDEFGCDSTQQIRYRDISKANQLLIYIGPVAFADTVIKSGQYRDKIAREEKLIRFEIEETEIWDNVPYIIIKNIYDYTDSHKNKLWQIYTAATGVSVAKALLEYWISKSREGKSRFQESLRSISNICPADKLSASHPFFRNIFFSKNKNFVGRDGQLSRLENLLFSPGRQHKVAITGLGGVGKIQIVLEFAYQIQQSRPEYSVY